MIATSHPHKALLAARPRSATGGGASAADPLALLNQLFRTASLLPPKGVRRESPRGACEAAGTCPEPARCAFAGCTGFCHQPPPAA